VKLRDKTEATPTRLKRTFETYEQLSRQTSQRVVHFLKVRETAQKQAAEAAARRQIRAKRG
jgi:inorganic pyrophosphatase